MKQIFLLIIACVIVGAANGQLANNSIVFNQSQSVSVVEPATQVAHPFHAMPNTLKPVSKAQPVQRTTAGGDRWYNYALYQHNILLGEANASYSLPFMWFDTSSRDVDTASHSLGFNHLLSVGTVFEPFIAAFNDPYIYMGSIACTPTDSYTIDSVDIAGVYSRNAALATTVDTLIISVVWGDGTGTSSIPALFYTDYNDTTHISDHAFFPYPRYGVDTLLFLDLWHDSTNNRASASASGGSPPFIVKVPLYAADVNDTDLLTYTHGSGTFAGLFHKVVPVSVAPLPGNLIGMSVTFKSGDTTAPSMPAGSPHFGDTVFTGTTAAPFKHGSFSPLVIYNNTGGTVQFPLYSPPDYNEGVFKTEPALGWGGFYLPMWQFENGTGAGATASVLQYPLLGFHVVCPGCYIVLPGDVKNLSNSINNVTTYPNPATSELNISFKLAQTGNVSISLTNMLGQVAAMQNMNNVSDGNAVFNTATLADGMYIYNLQSNGGRFTGHVAIAH